MNNSLRNMLQQLNEAYEIPIQEDCNDDLDELFEEENTTSNLDGGEGQSNTPFAFSKKVNDPKDVAYPKKVNSTERFYKKMEEVCNRLNSRVDEINYNDYRNDPNRTQKQKINFNILEINKKLREVEQMITHASKLKTETGTGQDVFWKGTIGNFLKIKERLNRLSNKIVEFSS